MNNGNKNGQQPATGHMELEPSGAPVAWHEGLTKREKFAMAAMQGLLSTNALYEGKENKTMLAIDAVNHADALLAVLDKKEGES